jgi:hypothetical protein
VHRFASRYALHGGPKFSPDGRYVYYAWVDALMSPRRDTLQLIDKQILELVRELTPAPGRALGHIEFTRDRRYALASLMERDGAIIVLDARTSAEVKRIPMKRPIGKYNVYNRIARTSGMPR